MITLLTLATRKYIYQVHFLNELSQLTISNIALNRCVLPYDVDVFDHCVCLDLFFDITVIYKHVGCRY